MQRKYIECEMRGLLRRRALFTKREAKKVVYRAEKVKKNNWKMAFGSHDHLCNIHIVQR